MWLVFGQPKLSCCSSLAAFLGAPREAIIGPESITQTVSVVLPIASLRSLVEVLSKAANGA